MHAHTRTDTYTLSSTELMFDVEDTLFRRPQLLV